MNQWKKQRGSALLISLMALVVMTLLAVSAINLSTVNLRIVTNYQERQKAQAYIQDALEQVISNPDNFSPDPATNSSGSVIYDANGQPVPKSKVTLTIPVTDTVTGTTVNITVLPRQCFSSTSLDGYSKRVSPPADNYWRMEGQYVTPSGATISIIQGARVTMATQC